MSFLRNSYLLLPQITKQLQLRHYPGSEDGKGSAGAIREAGGAFAKSGAAKEDEYFHKKRIEQLERLKKRKQNEEEEDDDDDDDKDDDDSGTHRQKR